MQQKTKKQNISLETDFTQSGLIIAGGLSILIIVVSILMIYLSTPPERIYAARVNGTPINLEEYNQTVKRTKSQYAQMLRMDFESPTGKNMLETIQRNTLDSLINREIFFQEAGKMNITVEPSEIDTEVENLKLKNFNGDDKLFHDTLRLNRTTLSQLKETLNKEKVVEKVKKAIVDEKVKISDKEAKEYYDKNKAEFSTPEEVKASHILVKDEKLANDISAKLAKGAKFEDLAKQYSTDAGSKVNGGDLGFFGKGKMVPVFETTAFAMKIGEISKPVKSQFGYHIIKKTGYNPAKQSNFADVKTKITDTLKEKKSNDVIEKFIKDEKAKSEIKMYVMQPLAPVVPSSQPSVTVQTSPSANTEKSSEKAQKTKPSTSSNVKVVPSK